MPKEPDQIVQARLLLLLSKIVYPDLPSHMYPVFMLLKYIKLAKRKLRFKVTVVPCEVICALSDGFVDVDNCILVNAGYHRAILDSAEYVKLKGRLVQVVPADVVEDCVYIGDVLKYNLGVCDDARLRPVGASDVKLADEVDVALIATHHNLPGGVTDSLLRSYFERPRLLHRRDTFAVSVKDHAPDAYYTNLRVNEVDYVHFKCQRIGAQGVTDCSGGYFCVVGATTLKQTADICASVPPRPRIAKDVVFEAGDWLDACPGGLEGHLEKLERAVRPFLCKRKLKLNPIFLVQGSRGSGKHLLVSALSRRSGLKLCRLTNAELSAQAYAQNEIKIRNAFYRAKVCAPCIVAITGFENLCKNNEGQHDQRIVANFKAELDALFTNNEHPLIVVCLSNAKDLPSELGRLFLETITVEAPNQNERLEMLKWITDKKCDAQGVDLTDVAGKTHGFVFEDLEALVFRAEAGAMFDGDRPFVTHNDFENALDAMQSNYTESLGAPKVPKVLWSDVGGLDDVKQEIVRTINLPLKHPELLKNGLKRSGILLYGPPGTGKTLMAKAVATECALCFLSVKGPELLNMYVGQSEQNVREVFKRARSASPCVIFFDELDSLAPNRGMSGDSGGVMDRVVSQLLAEMDGLNEKATVFVIGATNRPDLVDPALLRPGRFDRLLYVGPCTDYASKLGVLKALTRKFHLSDKLSLEKIVKSCPENITGADFYGICSNAWLSAAGRLIRKIEKGKAEKDETKVVLTAKDFEESIKSTKPSVSADDLRYFERLKRELSVKK